MNGLRLLSATINLGDSSFRNLTYRGRPHVYASAVGLLGNLVVRGLYSTGPEYVPGEVLADGAASFVGCPIFSFHPDGGARSAPGYTFGEVGTATYSAGALQLGIYLDPRAALDVAGDDGEPFAVVRDVLADRMVEISVGAWVILEERRGYADGQIYDYVWTSPLVGDHVAVGLASHGGLGSCSINRGCGLNRELSVNATLINEVHVMCETANCNCEHTPPDPWQVPAALANALGLKSTAPARRPTPASLAAALALAGPGATFVDGRVLDAGKLPCGYATSMLTFA